MFRRGLLLLLLLLLGGCALNPFESAYIPPGAPLSAEGPPAVAIGRIADPHVADALRNSLAARSLLAAAAPSFLLSVDVLTPAASGPMSDATVRLHFVLTDAAGRVRYAGDSEAEGSKVIASGAEDRRKAAAQILAQAIDDAIDRPAFRAALTPDTPPRDTIL